MAEQLALHLSIDQAGAYRVVVHGLGHQRIALRPVIAALGDEPDAHGIAAGHQPEAVVLDLVNPIGAGRGLVGRRWEAGFDAARPVSGQALTHTLNQHAANLGGGGGESSRETPGCVSEGTNATACSAAHAGPVSAGTGST